jgi:hypothetical protein
MIHMPGVTVAALEAEWSAIRAKFDSAEGRGFLEKSLLLRGPIEISAIVRLGDNAAGIAIRSPFKWMARGWQVQRYGGIRIEPAIDAHGSIILPLYVADEDAVEVFALLTTDLLTVASSPEPSEVTARRLLDRLALWLRFFRRFSAPLSVREVRGLLGELSCLQLILDAMGADAALAAWKGPEDALHDFVTDRYRIEVKTWGSDSSPRIVISEPGQIVIDDGWPVYVCGLPVLKDELNGVTLPQEIDRVRQRLPDGLKHVFEALAADAGYLDAHSDYYRERFAVMECAFYRMSAGFPWIDPGSIAPGIVNLRYAIEVTTLKPFLSPSPISGDTP